MQRSGVEELIVRYTALHLYMKNSMTEKYKRI